MVFSSILFLLYFLPVFLTIYWLLNKRFKNAFLVIVSIAFYTWGAPQFVLILLGSTIIDFYLVKSLHSADKLRNRKLLLVASLTMNLGLLAYFKYANFFIENFNRLLNSFNIESVGWTSVALPIGISFYTFQTLTYAIDIYRREHAPLKKLGDYLLYIMSFPQMIAGPIVRFKLIADQIPNRNETIDDKILGFFRFCIGLAKKVFIANVLGEVASQYLNTPIGELNFTQAWIGILAYTFQIYFDFAGYSDMAIGLGRMIGFTFPENFNNPYNSRSITEFWRRWHITLSSWMRDYLYIPLGGSRVNSKFRLYFNLGFVFLVSGLWHGASWNFVLWGAYHGLFLILDRLFLKAILDKLGKFVSVTFTFFVVVIGWVFFSIEDINHALSYIVRLLRFDFYSLPNLSIEFWFTLSLAFLFSFIGLLSFGEKLEKRLYLSSVVLVQQLIRIALSAIIFAFSVAAIAGTGFNPFIYFRF